MPQISVIVPVYKVEKYLRECVDSILAQTYTDFELILVDDGSPDSCGAICDEYAAKDSRIRVIHQENLGQAGARNTALDVAEGEYITFVDSDDIVSNVYLEVLLGVMHEDVDITVCKFLHFEDGTEPCPILQQMTCPQSFDAQSVAVAIFNGQISAGPCGKLYRAKIIDKRRFPVGRIHEDVVFTPIVCYAAKKTVLFAQELYYYRQHTSSTIHSKFNPKRYDAIWATDYCVRYFADRGENAVVQAAQRKRSYYLVTYAILAYRDKVKVPAEYRISIPKALWRLRKMTDDSYFQYYLAQLHPKLPILHAYWVKIKKILRIAK